MKLYTQDEAGLVAPYELYDNYDKNPDGWVAHYPGVDRKYTGDLADSFRALRGFERYAMLKDWWGLAYDYWVDLGGHAGIGRGTARSGATSGDYDEDGIPNNNETDAILFIIGVDQPVTRAMMDATQDLVEELGGLREYFVGHRQAKGIITPCPGDSVMEYIVKPLSEGKDLRNVAAPGEPIISPPKPHPVEKKVTPKVDWRKAIYDDMDLVNLSGVSANSRTWVRGASVKVLQAIEVANDVAPRNTIKSDGSLDGIGGPGTREALRKLQNKFGIPDDLIAGPITYENALHGLGIIDLSDVTSNYKTWVRGVRVAIVQTLLVAGGVAPANTITSNGDVDGVGGPGTHGALLDFQRKSGLTVDGIVGPKTYRALLVK